MTVEVGWKWSFFFGYFRKIRQSYTKKSGHLKGEKNLFKLGPESYIFPSGKAKLSCDGLKPCGTWFPLVFSGSQGWENTVGGYIGLYGSVNTFKNKAVGQGYT